MRTATQLPFSRSRTARYPYVMPIPMGLVEPCANGSLSWLVVLARINQPHVLVAHSTPAMDLC
jgi:hypothetical protein